MSKQETCQFSHCVSVVELIPLYIEINDAAANSAGKTVPVVILNIDTKAVPMIIVEWT
jgi:hypothetical protein